ncbi:MAG TPA: endonuclease III [Planctomycetota bacterium]|nr:endonuclease III [Planctomycetota bacterium]
MPATDAPKKRIGPLLRALRRTYPEARCALRHENALQLLVATILSAQCTDVRVNQVTGPLFAKYRSAGDFAVADPLVFQSEIRPTGFFRAKTKSILGAGKMLVERHGGNVPDTMEELLELPGVARKTANVVLGTWFRKATGVVVDTHVDRLSHRLKLTREKTPEKIERDLMRLVPENEWIDFSHRLIWHGRLVCTARSPKCEKCPLRSWCPSKGKV